MTPIMTYRTERGRLALICRQGGLVRDTGWRRTTHPDTLPASWDGPTGATQRRVFRTLPSAFRSTLADRIFSGRMRSERNLGRYMWRRGVT